MSTVSVGTEFPQVFIYDCVKSVNKSVSQSQITVFIMLIFISIKMMADKRAHCGMDFNIGFNIPMDRRLSDGD